MKNFVRGGIVLTLLCFCVVLIYAQTSTTEILSSANDSQEKLNITEFDSNTTTGENLKEETIVENNFQEQDKNKGKQVKEVVKKTVSVRSTAAGKYTATAYCLKGRTALGHGVRRGIIAADPRVLRLGSQVSLGAGSYSGQYLVSDTGGRIKGRKIDIWVSSCAEARRFGRRSVTISPL